MHARAYLRASTAEQDATREQVEAFAAERGLPIVGTYMENELGVARPARALPAASGLQAGRRASGRAS